MNNLLRYISISHKTASVIQRERYQISAEEKKTHIADIRSIFPDITGLFLLVTCNRTEIYFESKTTTAFSLRDFFTSMKISTITSGDKRLFNCSDSTEHTVAHLLNVSSGLSSSVLGDAEIIHQIKKAYQLSMDNQLQGSLLERAMQSVFKTHKRISNETHFRDGTTSIAYKSLKAVHNINDEASAKTKKILFIGAGDIVKQLFKYNSKFGFSNIYVSNRTSEKAEVLANKYQSKVFDWSEVLNNNFLDFDVIISAVGNCQRLITDVPVTSKKMLLIDLAMPGNIDKALGVNPNIILHDLDSISAELEDTKERRAAAIHKVKIIAAEELQNYDEWIKRAPLRAFLAKYKIVVGQKLKNYAETDSLELGDPMIKIITNRVLKKLMKQKTESFSSDQIDVLISEQIISSNKTLNVT